MVEVRNWSIPIAFMTLPIAFLTLPIAFLTLPIAFLTLPIAFLTRQMLWCQLAYNDWSLFGVSLLLPVSHSSLIGTLLVTPVFFAIVLVDVVLTVSVAVCIFAAFLFVVDRGVPSSTTDVTILGSLA